MRVRFWGVRGSIPTPLEPHEVEAKVIAMAEAVVRAQIKNPEQVAGYLRERHSIFSRGTVGGNTTCISITVGNNTYIIDAGSGIKNLGKLLMDGSFGRGEGELHLLMTHTHWDHIMGFPYFDPLFQKNNIHIYGAPEDLEERFRYQQGPNHFPVPLDIFPANLNFHKIDEGKEYKLPNAKFVAKKLNHPGGCLGYKIIQNGRSVVISTDSEIKRNDKKFFDEMVEFVRDTDLLVYDSQYTVEESKIKEDWGHSTAVMGVDLSIKAGVKRLALFHHEPNYPDSFLHEQLNNTRRYKNVNYPDSPLEILMAIEGMEIKF